MLHLLRRVISPLKAVQAKRSFSTQGGLLPPPPPPPLPATCRRNCPFQLVGTKPCTAPSAWIVFMNRNYLQLPSGYIEPIVFAFNLKGIYEGLSAIEKTYIHLSWLKWRRGLKKSDISKYSSIFNLYCRPSVPHKTPHSGPGLKTSFQVIKHNWDKHSIGFPNLGLNFYCGRLSYYAIKYCDPTTSYYLGLVIRGRKNMTAEEVYDEALKVLKRGVRVYAQWRIINGLNTPYLDGIHFLESCQGTEDNVAKPNAFNCSPYLRLSV